MIKWTGKRSREWMQHLLNKRITHGLPDDWIRNWIKALYKKGDVNKPTNYRTIMLGSCMAKLLRSIIEQALSQWAESNGKWAKG